MAPPSTTSAITRCRLDEVRLTHRRRRATAWAPRLDLRELPGVRMSNTTGSG